MDTLILGRIVAGITSKSQNNVYVFCPLNYVNKVKGDHAICLCLPSYGPGFKS